MMPPVKCFSCNRSDIGYYYKQYLGLVRKGYDESDALDALQITDDCCRVQFLTTNDLSDQIIASGRPVTIDYKMKEEEGKKQNPRKIGDLGQMVVQDVQKYPSRVGPDGPSRENIWEQEIVPALGATAVFMTYEGIEFLTTPEEVPVLESELGGFANSQLNRKLRQGAPVEDIISEGPIDLNSNFWNQIRWIVGFGPQKEIQNKYYDEFLAMNGSLTLAFKLIEGVSVEVVFAEEEGLQAVTPHQLVEGVDEFALSSMEGAGELEVVLDKLRKDVEGGSPVPSSVLILFAVKCLKMMESPISVASIRRFFAVDFSNQAMEFVSFDYREEGSYKVTMRNDLIFNDREKLAQSVTTGKIVKKVDRVEEEDVSTVMILNDGAKFEFHGAFYISENSQVIARGYENRLVERRIEVIMYPRSEGNKKLSFSRKFPVIIFDDLSFLVLTSRLRTASFGM